MTDPTPQTRRWVPLRRDNFIKDREHRRMASYVVDFDEGGAPVDWPQRRDCQSVGLTVIVGDLIGRRDQSAQATAPYHPLICWIHRTAICIPRELITAPVPLVLDKGSRSFYNLKLEWSRHGSHLKSYSSDLSMRRESRLVNQQVK